MITYCLGFFFEYDQTTRRFYVVMIQKKRTDPRRRGRVYWNGIGGKIEADRGEEPVDAMGREYLQETGQQTTRDQWRRVAVIESPGAFSESGIGSPESYAIHVFKGSGVIDPSVMGQRGDEGMTNAFAVRSLPVATDLTGRWLIPLCLDNTFNGFASCEIKQGGDYVR